MGNQTSKGNNSTAKVEVEDEAGKKKRSMVIEEIVQTEKTYVNYLCVLDELYIEPLKKKPIVSQDNIKIIFGSIDPIIQFHRDFFTELAITYNSFDWVSTPVSPPTRTTTVTVGGGSSTLVTTTTTTTTISNNGSSKFKTTLDGVAAIVDLFNKHRQSFKIYSSFIVGYDNAFDTLTRMRKKSAFNQFLDRARSDPKSNSQDINSLLILPVQRLPRYILLLNELMKSLPQNHPHIKLMDNCIEGIKNVTQFINEAKRDDENSIKMKEYQDTLIDKVNVLEPGRKLLYDGICGVHSIYPLKDKDDLLKRIRKHRKDKKGSQGEAIVFPEEFKQNVQLQFCIFNDAMVLLSKPPKSSISNLLNASRVWGVYDCSLLEQVKVIDVLDIFGLKHCIIIITEKQTYFMIMPNSELKDKFMKSIVMSKVEYRKSLAGTGFSPDMLTSSGSSSNLPSLLTLRPQPPKSGGSFLSFSTGGSSSSSGNKPNHSKSVSTGSFLTLGKSSGKKVESNEKDKPVRKNTFFS